MPSRSSWLALLPALVLSADQQAVAADATATEEVFTLNTPRTFVPVESAAHWRQLSDDIREQAQVSCGLWPMPEKTPLHARVFGRIERNGYTVEKVHFESFPGFYVAGNLYRPLGQGEGPFPAILNPHGHWEQGRLVDSETGSVPARCIQFARMGIVALSIDMIGYNDTSQFSPRNPDGSLKAARFYDDHVKVAQSPKDWLWGISLMGLQTWNCIRALDFLESLADVDPNRLGCTGASGGGSQTFMLGAIDRRLAMQAPIVMVSHTMQGGCWCENAPGLRVRYSNMEIAASAAPRPQLLVSATGDWTRATMEVEGPAIEKVYALLDAEDRFDFERYDFDHNYNETTREAVYRWVSPQLLDRPAGQWAEEHPYEKPDDSALQVFPGGQFPSNAKTYNEFMDWLREMMRDQFEQSIPSDRQSLESFRSVFAPLYRHTFQLDSDPQRIKVRFEELENTEGLQHGRFLVQRNKTSDPIPVHVWTPEGSGQRKTIVLIHPLGIPALVDQQGKPAGEIERLLAEGFRVAAFDPFLRGSRSKRTLEERRQPFVDFFSVYNRTDLQERVGDIVAVSAFARSHYPGSPVVLWGMEEAGPWALAAAPAGDGVVADIGGMNLDDPELLVQSQWFVPGIQRLGGFSGIALLASDRPLFLNDATATSSFNRVQQAYRALGNAGELQLPAKGQPAETMSDWLKRQQFQAQSN